jgi:hypothetical protein
MEGRVAELDPDFLARFTALQRPLEGFAGFAIPTAIPTRTRTPKTPKSTNTTTNNNTTKM